MTSHVVKRLPVDTGRSGWEAISHRPFPVRALDAALAADWLIVGAGFAGLSAARRLTQVRPGERIVVLEARELAQGPAGRNSGFMIDVPHDLSSGEYASGDAAGARLEMAQNRLAIGFATEAAAEYGMPAATFDPCGKINAAASERGLKLNESFAASLERIGEPLRRIDAAEMRAITGSDYYLGGLYTPGAALIEPADYIRAFAAGLGSRIELYENSPVVALSREGATWTARTSKGSVSAPKAILGVNGLVQEFGHFRGRLMHVFTYASMTAPFAGRAGRDRWALLPADPMGATLRKVTHGQEHACGHDGCRPRDRDPVRGAREVPGSAEAAPSPSGAGRRTWRPRGDPLAGDAGRPGRLSVRLRRLWVSDAERFPRGHDHLSRSSANARGCAVGMSVAYPSRRACEEPRRREPVEGLLVRRLAVSVPPARLERAVFRLRIGCFTS